MTSSELRTRSLALLASLLLHLVSALALSLGSDSAAGDRRQTLAAQGGERTLAATLAPLRASPTLVAKPAAPASASARPPSAKAAPESPAIVPPQFFAIDQLDSAPYPSDGIDLSSGLTQNHGTIGLEIKVADDGQVVGVTVIDSGFSADDTKAIEKMVWQKSFQPGMRHGRQVNSIVNMHISLLTRE